MIRVFEVMAFEQVSWISLNYDENTFERQSTYYERVLRFHIWFKEIFSGSSCLGLMENLDESAAVPISAAFLTPEHVDSPKVF